MTRPQRVVCGLALSALLAWLGGGCAGVPTEGDVYRVEAPAPPAAGKVEVGKGYFDFTAQTLTGETIRLSDLVGGRKAVLLQFWGIRCAPCLSEMEKLTIFQDQYGPRGLQVLGVNTDRVEAEALSEALDRRGLSLSYPNVLDSDFEISRHYTRWLIPVTVLIDRDGVVQAVHTGYRPELDAQIVAEIEQVLR